MTNETFISTKMIISDFLQNIMILGDFNADGAYVTAKEMKAIRIRSDKNFHWLIGDDVDTTAKTSNEHTYDRHVYIHIFHSCHSRENAFLVFSS